ncbi:hypothetical protein ACQCU1_01585 [Sutcliffiella horikoshii]|uniref:hypothetical protein n=1 Tax=Sutcliffiella horikoshii TaxID=79883 RepID=UPI003CF5E534
MKGLMRLLKRRRSKTGNRVIVIIIGTGLIFIFFYIVFSLLINAERDARKIVSEFYHYESNGNYGESWELLHTEMQIRFDRGTYVQDRAHVFNGHFGTDTFTYEVSEGKKTKEWRMIKDGETFKTVYEFKVQQDFKGKYGHFMFVQYVFVGKEEGEWRILWDYNK